jgi:hypothetical protein
MRMEKKEIVPPRKYPEVKELKQKTLKDFDVTVKRAPKVKSKDFEEMEETLKIMKKKLKK